MNPPKCSVKDYIQFLIASSVVFTCTEAARCHPFGDVVPSHDSYTRLLRRMIPNTLALWREAADIVQLQKGYLIVDDTTLDKPYSKVMELVCRHWSGKHHRVVKGINLITLVWTDGYVIIPIDFRIYDKNNDGKTKNDHLRDMLLIAAERGFQPKFVLFDSWYASCGNFKAIKKLKWHWMTRLKKNRLVNPDNTKNVQINTVEISSEGRVVHLKRYGFVKIFRTVSKDGNVEYWATDVTYVDGPQRKELAHQSWKIEEYHRGIKQFCGVERCQARNSQSQRAHIQLSIRAFLRLEMERLRTGRSWFEIKREIEREAIRAYIKNPRYVLSHVVTA